MTVGYVIKDQAEILKTLGKKNAATDDSNIFLNGKKAVLAQMARAYASSHDISLSVFSKTIGIDGTYFYKAVSGSWLRVSTFCKIAKALGILPVELFKKLVKATSPVKSASDNSDEELLKRAEAVISDSQDDTEVPAWPYKDKEPYIVFPTQHGIFVRTIYSKQTTTLPIPE